MNELGRILSSRRRMIVLLLLPLLSLGLFLLQEMQGVLRGGWTLLQETSEEYKNKMAAYDGMDPAEIAQQEEMYYSSRVDLRDQAAHVRDYEQYLKMVQAQAERMSSSLLFSKDKNSFTYRNILKTAKDFENLHGVSVEFGSDRAVESWLQFKTADVFHLLAILIFVLAFLEERRNGLHALVRSTKKGRSYITAVRVGILCGASTVYALLLYAVPLVTGFLIYGGAGDMGRSIQSLAAFKTCTLHLSVLEWILLFLIIKAACAFFVGMFFWFVLSFLSQIQLAWFVILGIIGAEYLAYTLITPQMAVSFLRYVNILSFISPAELLSRYQNMNFFSLPVGSLTLMTWLFGILILLVTAGVIVVQNRRYPFGNRSLLERVLRKLNRFFDIFRSRFSVGLTEAYKLFVLGGAVIFLAIGIFLGLRMRLEGWHYIPGNDGNMNERMKAEYKKQILGPFNEEKANYLLQARKRLEADPGISAVYSDGLKLLEQEIVEAKTRAENGRYQFWIVDDVPINNHFGPKVWDLTRQNAFVVMAVVILCSAQIFVIERHMGTNSLLHATKRGRSNVFWRKYMVLAFVVLIVWAAVYGREWHELSVECGREMLNAPVGNYGLFADLPLSVRLGSFLAILNLIRLTALFFTACITAWFSMRSESWERTALLSSSLILIPAALCYFEQSWAGMVSLLPFVNGSEVLIRTEKDQVPLWMISVWFFMAVFLICDNYKRWTEAQR